MQDNKYREASQLSVDLISKMFLFVFEFLVGFYDPIVKKHEDNVRDIRFK